MKYCAFLRGINVNGVKIKMADLKQNFESHGFADIQTILATGNVIFSSETAPNLSFLPVKTFIKTEAQLREIWQAQPLTAKENYHIYVFIADSGFANTAQLEFENLGTAAEQAATVDDTFYWQVPVGSTLDSPFGKILGKKQYKELFTSRNINTIERILKKL